MESTALRGPEAYELPAQALGRLRPFPRRWQDLLDHNCAERALRGIVLGRWNWTFAGSQRSANRAAIMLTMITTCRLNEVNAKAWLANVLARIVDLPASRLHELP
ncbi:hypothetical protein ACVMIH_007949 [Bradyrhizobium sp. USDA 4503]